MTTKRLRSYQEYLLASLLDPEEARAYLNAALIDDDPRIFLLAIKNVIDAQEGSIVALSQKTDLNRENLYRMLSKRGNPRLTSIKSVLNALDLDLAVRPYQRR